MTEAPKFIESAFTKLESLKSFAERHEQALWNLVLISVFAASMYGVAEGAGQNKKIIAEPNSQLQELQEIFKAK